MSNGARKMICATDDSDGAGRLTDGQLSLPANLDRTTDAPREALPPSRAPKKCSSPFAIRGYVRYSRAGDDPESLMNQLTEVDEIHAANKKVEIVRK
jgi:hypothetical protein